MDTHEGIKHTLIFKTRVSLTCPEPVPTAIERELLNLSAVTEGKAWTLLTKRKIQKDMLQKRVHEWIDQTPLFMAKLIVSVVNIHYYEEFYLHCQVLKKKNAVENKCLLMDAHIKVRNNKYGQNYFNNKYVTGWKTKHEAVKQRSQFNTKLCFYYTVK